MPVEPDYSGGVTHRDCHDIAPPISAPCDTALQMVLALLGFCGVVAVLLCTSRYGVGTFADAENYIGAARNLLAGQGYRCYYGVPFAQWPPLFPTLLAAIGLAGVDPQEGARWLNAMAFGLIVLFSGQLFMKCTASKALVVAGTLSVLASKPLLDWSMMAASEPIFVLLTLLFGLCVLRFLRTRSLSALVLTAIVACLACLQRYAGISLVLAGSLLILPGKSGTRLLRKVGQIAIFGAISTFPLALWCIRNRLIAGRTVGDHESHLASAGELAVPFIGAMQVMAAWLFPWATSVSGIHVVGFGLAIVLAFATILLSRVVRAWRRRAMGGAANDCGPQLWSLAIVAGIYFVFIIVCGAVLNWIPRQRHMAPLYAFIVALMLVGVEGIHRLLIDRPVRRALVGSLCIILCILWLQYPGRVLCRNVRSCMEHGAGGYAVSQWQDSPLVAWLRSHPLPDRVFCNGSDAAYLLTRAVTSLTPQWKHETALADFARLGASQTSYLVWFNEIRYPWLYDLREILSCCRVKEIARFPDGCVYQCLGEGGPPISAVYRFWSLRTGRHLYTIDKAQWNKVRKSSSFVWKDENVVFYAFAKSQPGTHPVYHLWSEPLDAHRYTIDEAEKDKLVHDEPDTWTCRDVAFYAYPEKLQADLVPVYRLSSRKPGGCLYTASERERNKVIEKGAGEWIDEGIAWYAYQR
jgi:hypothetical protein